MKSAVNLLAFLILLGGCQLPTLTNVTPSVHISLKIPLAKSVSPSASQGKLIIGTADETVSVTVNAVTTVAVAVLDDNQNITGYTVSLQVPSGLGVIFQAQAADATGVVFASATATADVSATAPTPTINLTLVPIVNTLITQSFLPILQGSVSVYPAQTIADPLLEPLSFSISENGTGPITGTLYITDALGNILTSAPVQTISSFYSYGYTLPALGTYYVILYSTVGSSQTLPQITLGGGK